jgi:hypothetical protein
VASFSSVVMASDSSVADTRYHVKVYIGTKVVDTI